MEFISLNGVLSRINVSELIRKIKSSYNIFWSTYFDQLCEQKFKHIVTQEVTVMDAQFLDTIKVHYELISKINELNILQNELLNLIAWFSWTWTSKFFWQNELLTFLYLLPQFSRT